MATRVGRTAAPRATKRASPPSEDVTSEHRNEVTVSGRLSAAALGKELPSGDEIVTWRLVVDRGSVDGNRKVDVVDCTTFRARVRRQALAWTEGDVIEVVGSLRRRFWRGAGGLQSRCEVEVETASRRAKGGAVSRTAGRRRSGVGESADE
jgi:single-strand DNA-binding protein